MIIFRFSSLHLQVDSVYPDLKTAGRGIPIQIELPNNNKVSTNGAPIVYRGIEIGQITDIQLSLDIPK
jgi:paraquat-inducible protein B